MSEHVMYMSEHISYCSELYEQSSYMVVHCIYMTYVVYDAYMTCMYMVHLGSYCEF